MLLGRCQDGDTTLGYGCGAVMALLARGKDAGRVLPRCVVSSRPRLGARGVRGKGGAEDNDDVR